MRTKALGKMLLSMLFLIGTLILKASMQTALQVGKKHHFVTKNSIIRSHHNNIRTPNQPNPKFQAHTPCEKVINISLYYQFINVEIYSSYLPINQKNWYKTFEQFVSSMFCSFTSKCINVPFLQSVILL